jgi:hypothetical protein
MIDGHLRRVVMFPENGHTDFTAQVLDVTGDARDEVILWDETERLDLHPGWPVAQEPPVRPASATDLQRFQLSGEHLVARLEVPRWRQATGRRQSLTREYRRPTFAG